jgi:hypothetical protein
MPDDDDNPFEGHDRDNRMGRYVLDADGNPVPEPDLFKWATWFERTYRDGSRQVARDELEDGHWVSTVFLGLDHSVGRLLGNDEPPQLYETMVFNDYGSLDTDWASERYATRSQALEGHAAALTELKLYLQKEISADRG